MQEFLKELYLIFRLLLVVSLPIFMAFSLTRKSQYKYLIMFIVSAVVLVFTSLIYVLDNYVLYTNITFRVYLYLMILSGIYFILFMVLFLVNIKKIRYRQNLKPKKQKMVYTYHEKKEYLYYFFTLNDDLLLLDKVLTGVKVKLKPSEFSDEEMDKILKDNKIDTFASSSRRGTLTVKGEKTDDIYYCYMIDLAREIDTYRIASGLVKISKMDFLSRDVTRVDKYIIIKSISSDHFDDTL